MEPSTLTPSSLGAASQSVLSRAHSHEVQRIALPYLNRTVLVTVDDIVSMSGEGNYTYIHTRDRKRYLVSKTLKAFEALLDKTMFLRIHKSTIVNLGYIQMDAFSTDRNILLTDGREVSISRRRAKEIMKRLQVYRLTLVN